MMPIIELGSGKIIFFGIEVKFFDVDDIIVDVDLQRV